MKQLRIGVQTPTYRSAFSSYRQSYGHDAVEISSIAGQEQDEWQCDFLVDAMGIRSDRKWVTRDVGLVVPRQNGKGGILEALVLCHLFTIDDTKLILWTAHEFKTAEEAFLRMKDLIENSPELMKYIKIIRTQAGKEGIELTNGSRVRFIARSRASGRGFSADLVILDEAYDLTDVQLSAILPTVLARPNPQIWYVSSAPLLTSVVLRRICKRGRAKKEGLTYAEWCAQPKENDSMDSRELWRQANPGYGIRIEDDAILSLYNSMEAEDFEREVLGIWSENEEEAAIDLEAWANLGLNEDEAITGDVVAIAVDVSPDRKYACIAAASGGVTNYSLVEIIDFAVGTKWVVQRLVELTYTHKPIVLVVDERSPAASLLTDLEAVGFSEVKEEPDWEEGQILVTTSTAELAQACGSFYDSVVDAGNIRHLKDVDLNKAVEGASWRPLGESRAWSRVHSNTTIAPLVAVTLALHGLRVYGDIEDEDLDAFVFFSGDYG